MNTQSNHALVASKSFALICSYKAPTTDLSPDFVPSVSVCVGVFATQEQAKKALTHSSQHVAFIGAMLSMGSMDFSQADQAASKVLGGVQ